MIGDGGLGGCHTLCLFGISDVFLGNCRFFGNVRFGLIIVRLQGYKATKAGRHEMAFLYKVS